MSPMIEISDRDILRSKLVQPGWYKVRIESCNESLSKAGDSTNFVMEATILRNADTGKEDFAGVPTPYWNFNSKAPGFVVGFLLALGTDAKAGRYDLSKAVGKEIDVFIKNELYEGRMVNKMNHEYRAPRS